MKNNNIFLQSNLFFSVTFCSNFPLIKLNIYKLAAKNIYIIEVIVDRTIVYLMSHVYVYRLPNSLKYYMRNKKKVITN